jgi:hypothetical protein
MLINKKPDVKPGFLHFFGVISQNCAKSQMFPRRPQDRSPAAGKQSFET